MEKFMDAVMERVETRSITLETIDDYPAEYKELVIKQLMAHAEGELSGADDYVKLFYPLTNDFEEKRVCCELAIEELDHYELAAVLLKDLGKDTSFMLAQTLEERSIYATEGVKECASWGERALISYLLEAAVVEILKEMAESSYKPLADMCPRVIKEENLHIAHGFRITRDMCKTVEGKEEIQTALERMWPVTLDSFGTSDSKRSPLYIKWGLRKLTNGEARNNFIDITRPKLEKLGLKVPDDTKNRKFS
jgi:ring-1,2-phenylacetyl-CoA epoxidase subunit PaaA